MTPEQLEAIKQRAEQVNAPPPQWEPHEWNPDELQRHIIASTKASQKDVPALIKALEKATRTLTLIVWVDCEECRATLPQLIGTEKECQSCKIAQTYLARDIYKQEAHTQRVKLDACVRPLLEAEWSANVGWDADSGCPSCEAFANRHEHLSGCSLDAALTVLGLDTQEKRNQRRKELGI
jgi:hypothetical protein